MFSKVISHCRTLLLAAISILYVQTGASAETFVGSNVDNRVLVGVNAPSKGIEALLPEGWALMPFPGGPLAGANVLFVFIDTLSQRDAEGEPISPAARRALALASLGKQDDKVRLFVLRIYNTKPESDPYGVNVAADIMRKTGVEVSADDKRKRSDEWIIQTAENEKITFTLDYETGNRNWAPAEALPYSAKDPDFSRIYRVKQLTDLVASTALEKPASGTFTLTNGLSDLTTILDGSEDIVAVIDVPMYVREIFLP